MKSTTLLLGAACALALATLGGCASNEVEPPMTNQGEAMHFNTLDKDESKYITTEELPTDHALLHDFTQCDLNGDGKISEHEFGEYLKTL